MTNARRSLQSDPFIQQDPNAHRYSKRLLREQWKEIKPRVLEHLNQGSISVDILRELQSHNTLITQSQLRGQIKKGGFQKGGQESPPPAVHVSWDPASSKQTTFHEKAPNNSTQLLSVNDIPRFLTMNSAISSTDSNLESELQGAKPASSFEPTTQTQISNSQYTADVCKPYMTVGEDLPFPSSLVPSECSKTNDLHDHDDQSPFANASITHRICSSSVAKHGVSIKTLRRLGYVATLLFALNCYGEAFHISLYIIDQLNGNTSLQRQPRQLLPFSVITWPVTLAHGKTRRLTFTCLETYAQLSIWHPSGQEANQQSASYMQILRVSLAPVACEPDKATAYWILNIVLSSPQADDEHNFQPDPLLCMTLDDALRFFHKNRDIRNPMGGAIDQIKEILSVNNGEIDGVWSKYWQRGQDKFFVGQTLACLLLKHRRGHGLSLGKAQKTYDTRYHSLNSENKSWLPCVFCSGSCIGATGVASRVWLTRLKLSEILYLAALSIERAIKNGAVTEGDGFEIPQFSRDYKGYIDIYLRGLDSCPWPSRTASCDERLIGIPALQAKVSTESDLKALGILLLAPNPRCRSEVLLDHVKCPTAKASRRGDHYMEFSTTDLVLGPPLARSYASSLSSGDKSFKALAIERGALEPRKPGSISLVPAANWSDGLSSIHESLEHTLPYVGMHNSFDRVIEGLLDY
ncbi:uncharacterized protein Z519_02485 [Cladophialophora bantiana CBS 173.52]|uniref:Clr5 domain-containing protein n=1 Tax=Cladophialophora bantiana (strain ATCC 10958 / CBS 173.52 / CDC B-1940 / NIH 8579) TaxID=1442370 RepID=A0A0D2HUP5_CLAB1|nr:uncharacterized protein Z519_02485 [Cladophialophora bantiana CBS 173.52]KIW97093.1 hypothetical protein Z519_02485 [Cladophialophora bantiana CBS 173.52]